MEAGERVNALGTKKLFPLIVSMSIPAICGNITTALYNLLPLWKYVHLSASETDHTYG